MITRLNKIEQAFTLLELLFCCAIVTVAVLYFLTPAGKPRSARASRVCVDNLKNLGLAARVYAIDNSAKEFTTNAAPQSATAAGYLRQIGLHLASTKILVCPADTSAQVQTDFSTLENSHLSYFANPAPTEAQQEGDLLAFSLFGDRNLQTNGVAVARGHRLRVSPGMKWGWTQEMHNHQGSMVLADGSVQRFTNARVPQANLHTTLLVP